jgi:hypothetical protein
MTTQAPRGDSAAVHGRPLIAPGAWERAGWIAVGYLTHPERAPLLALVFRDGDAAIAIFSAWRAVLGEIDVADRIRIAVIEGALPTRPPGYAVHVAVGSHAEGNDVGPSGAWLHVPRPDDTHLRRFKESFAARGRYLLVPATVGAGIELGPRHGIGKRRLALRRVSDVGLIQDPDAGLWSWCGVVP